MAPPLRIAAAQFYAAAHQLSGAVLEQVPSFVLKFVPDSIIRITARRTGGGAAALFSASVSDVRVYPVPIDQGHASLDMERSEKSEGDVVFVQLPSGHYAVICRVDTKHQAMLITADTQFLAFKPKLAVRWFNSDVGGWFHVNLRTIEDFSLLGQCFCTSAAEANAQMAHDVDSLSHITNNLDAYM